MTAQRILIVEDTNIAQKMATILLSNLGFNVDAVANGEDAFSYYKINDYALIFMDLGLPGIDGYTTIKMIRDFEAQTSNYTPIVALTAHLGSDAHEKAMAAGADESLVKPLLEHNAKAVLEQFKLEVA